MKNILFLHHKDFFLNFQDELMLKTLINPDSKSGLLVSTIPLTDYKTVCSHILEANVVVIAGTIECVFENELFHFLVGSNIPYVHIELDANLCSKRNPLCSSDPDCRNCWDKKRLRSVRDIFANAEMNFFLSEKQYREFDLVFGKAIGRMSVLHQPEAFWQTLSEISNKRTKTQQTKLGKVLAKKSYGGLGDIFFAIPALHVLREMSDTLSFAVEARLVSFFQMHLPEIHVVDRELYKSREQEFDAVIELGNCPDFGRKEFPDQLYYTTHKKVKQHATDHYLDAIYKFHNKPKKISEYTHFKRETNFVEPYYTIHPGAGFLLKTWPITNYAELIEAIHNAFPGLGCKIIIGPNDPDPTNFISGETSFIERVTGGMHEVGSAMESALFHIGNDAGITHVAGAYNVPTVGIYGPTGPGAYGSLSEQSEIVWGKLGNCNIRCKYEVILACEHRICLTSITINMVMAALYRLLDKTYPELYETTIVSPDLQTIFAADSCKISIGQQEFDVHFTQSASADEVRQILNGNFSASESESMKPFMNFLRQQRILLNIPGFPKKADA